MKQHSDKQYAIQDGENLQPAFGGRGERVT